MRNYRGGGGHVPLLPPPPHPSASLILKFTRSIKFTHHF